MLYWLIPFILGMLLLGAFLFFRVKEKRVVAVVLKGLTSLLFIITALVAWLASSNPSNSLGIFVLIGLFFGLLGDVFLDIKFITKKHEFLFTALGFIAFGLGHIAYISGLFINFFDFSKSVLYLIIPIIASLLLMVVTLLMEKFTPIRYKNMKPYVIVYGFILFFVTTIYLSGAIQNGWHVTTLTLMFVGFILFALSDLILNNTYFAPGFTKPVFIISNHILYYFGQFLIAISLFFL